MIAMRATDLTAELDALAERLTAAGVRAATDPTQVPVPGAWVTVDTLTAERLCGDWTATAAVYLVARDTGHTAAVTDLMTMLDTLAEVAPTTREARPDTVTLPGHAGPLPALYTTTALGD